MKINSKIWFWFLRGEGGKFSRAVLTLLLFAFALQILLVWNGELSGRDSPRVAGIAREMAITSNYLIPRLNGKNFLEYPPLGYWPVALSLSMSDKPRDILSFLPIVFLGVGTVLITVLIGKALAGEGIGLIAGFILSTTSGFFTLHRHCLVDPSLLFFITLSLYGLAAGCRESRGSFLFSSIFHLAAAGAFLSKGLVGAAVPIATALVLSFIRKDRELIRNLFLSPSFLLFFLPIILWVGSVWWLEGLGIFEEVIQQSLSRFFSPTADHVKPVYSYIVPLLLHLMPWIPLPLVLLWRRSGPARPGGEVNHRSLLIFALVWFLTVFLGLSLASAKRPLYLGPLLPPFALLAALGWDTFREKFPRMKRKELYAMIFIFLAYAGVHHLFIIPEEREQSLRPIFEIVSNQGSDGPVYLVDPSETLRGAAFFYLGRRVDVLSRDDFFLRKFEDRPGTILVTHSVLGDNQLFSNIRSMGYWTLMQKKFGKGEVDCVYSNAPEKHKKD